jgi:hypothetical protein
MGPGSVVAFAGEAPSLRVAGRPLDLLPKSAAPARRNAMSQGAWRALPDERPATVVLHTRYSRKARNGGLFVCRRGHGQRDFVPNFVPIAVDDSPRDGLRHLGRRPGCVRVWDWRAKTPLAWFASPSRSRSSSRPTVSVRDPHRHFTWITRAQWGRGAEAAASSRPLLAVPALTAVASRACWRSVGAFR